MNEREEHIHPVPDAAHEDFARHVRGLLLESTESLDGATRSALTRARHAALSQAAMPGLRAVRPRWLEWAPAGAVAMALLVAVFVIGQHHATKAVVAPAGGSVEDLALVSDADAYALSTDGEMDLDSDFYEWAAAAGGPRRGVGS